MIQLRGEMSYKNTEVDFLDKHCVPSGRMEAGINLTSFAVVNMDKLKVKSERC